MNLIIRGTSSRKRNDSNLVIPFVPANNFSILICIFNYEIFLVNILKKKHYYALLFGYRIFYRLPYSFFVHFSSAIRNKFKNWVTAAQQLQLIILEIISGTCGLDLVEFVSLHAFWKSISSLPHMNAGIDLMLVLVRCFHQTQESSAWLVLGLIRKNLPHINLHG